MSVPYVQTHGAPGYQVVCSPSAPQQAADLTASQGHPGACFNHPGGVVWGCTFSNPRVTYLSPACGLGAAVVEANNERYFTYGGPIPNQNGYC